MALTQTLRALLRAKAQASQLEQRFLVQLAQAVPDAAARRGDVATDGRHTLGRRDRRTLQCPRCERRFARPLHLGRHLAATHKVKRKARR